MTANSTSQNAKTTKILRQKQKRWTVICCSIVVLLWIIGGFVALKLLDKSNTSSSELALGAIGKITVIGVSTSDFGLVAHGIYSEPPNTELVRALFEEGLSLQPLNIFQRAQIYVRIIQSIVTRVRMFVDFEYYYFLDARYDDGNYYMDYQKADFSDINVLACNGRASEENCSVCGSFNNDETYGWIVVKCEGGIEANEVQIHFAEKAIFLSSIEIWGRMFGSNSIRPLSISKGFSIGSNDEMDFKSIMPTIDKLEPESIDDCFISIKNKTSWVRYEIPWSVITHVNIRNVPKESENRLEGIFVDVCEFGQKCLPCGVVTQTELGETAGVYCTGGTIEGNEIQLTHFYDRLQFCEIEVFGKEADDDKEAMKLMTVLWATGTYQWFLFYYGVYDINDIGLLFDNDWSSCLGGPVDGRNPYVSMRIPSGYVTYINMLTREELWSSHGSLYPDAEAKFGVGWVDANSITVEVCKKAENTCSPCGRLTQVPLDSWATIFCEDGGVEGDKVNINFTLTYPCEIEIFGIELKS